MASLSFFFSKLVSQNPPKQRISLTTDDRLQTPGWWPTKGTASRSDFVGTAECARCHEKQALTYIITPMAQASAPAAYSQVLQSHDSLSAQLPPYGYVLSRNSAAVTYSVTRELASLSTTVPWAFGLGHKAQTYVYQRNSAFYESRLSFYKTLQDLDITTGHSSTPPDDLESALGRRMDAEETRRCFGCHTTGSTSAHRFDPRHVTPGVTCEACHGPGVRHVAAMNSGRIDEGRRAILNPRRLNPVASVDFCGACHRTCADVIHMSAVGAINARFQPYRLETSRCWQASQGDARLTCMACHDSHQQLVVEPASYDQQCLSCHTASANANAAAKPAQPACPVGTKECVRCHMPAVDLPSMHAPFTDHRIRIVRPGAPYPS